MEDEHSGAQISRVLDYLEGPGHRKLQSAMGVLGTVGTALMWWVRLSHTSSPVNIEIDVLILLAPPYAMVLGFANALARHEAGLNTTGPMSGYL